MDLVGEGIILATNADERERVQEFYFKDSMEQKELIPKYNPIESVFNNIGALREQILLLIHQGREVSIEDLQHFFENTYYAYNYSDDVKLEHRLLLKDVNISTALYLH
ncbi:MAG: hypothetical protein JW776_14750 [Candidatus Lokiarchaeota archaeon]|nr:hypothetical protein [Candidatus Lokiarchaeota archaeon]